MGTPEPQDSRCFLSSADLMTLRTVLAVFGKGCLSGSFSCLFLFTEAGYTPQSSVGAGHGAAQPKDTRGQVELWTRSRVPEPLSENACTGCQPSALNSPRQTGMGISNMWARVGKHDSPLVKITAELKPFIPNVIFGSIALWEAAQPSSCLRHSIGPCQRLLRTWKIVQSPASGPRSPPPQGSPGLFLSSLSLGPCGQRNQSRSQKQKRHIPEDPSAAS